MCIVCDSIIQAVVSAVTIIVDVQQTSVVDDRLSVGIYAQVAGNRRTGAVLPCPRHDLLLISR